MGKDSEISWTDHTFNVVWGCTKVSEACKRCYAEAFAKRTGHDVWGEGGDRRLLSDAYWNEPRRWHRDAERAGRRARVFCSSMADWAEDHPTVIAQLPRLWQLIEETPWLDWLLLTKRPERIRQSLSPSWTAPRPNVWLGTTVELQKYVEPRLTALLQVDAAVHFVSCEPLLEALDLCRFLRTSADGAEDRAGGNASCRAGPGIDWVIVGGESGGGARPFELRWAEALRDQCKRRGVAFFMKQLGARPIAGLGLRVADKKGSDWDEWPEPLRLREFPRPEGPHP